MVSYTRTKGKRIDNHKLDQMILPLPKNEIEADTIRFRQSRKPTIRQYRRYSDDEEKVVGYSFCLKLSSAFHQKTRKWIETAYVLF